MDQSKTLSGVEAVACSALTLFASPILYAYLLDRIGQRFPPFLMLAWAVASAAAVFVWLRRSACWRHLEAAAFGVVVFAVSACLVWIAHPHLLPIGGGPDLTHHLLLIRFIESNWRLVHDARVEMYLGEMIQYTPGSQILVALAGAWTGTDGLHAVHPVVAASVALKAGFVFLIALRLMPAAVPRIPLALTSVVLLLLPQNYAFGSFTHDSFYAQVVAELFAVAMWWAVVVWDDTPSPALAVVFALAGAAAFLTWPVLTAAPMVTFLVVLVAHRGLSLGERARQLGIAVLPILAIAGMYIAGRLGWVGIISTGGAVTRPDPSQYGWWFLGLSLAGAARAAVDRRGRATALFLGAIGLEALALYLVARANGADTPYLALKMFYLAVWPQAVLAALAIATAWKTAARVDARVRQATAPANVGRWLAWAFLLAISIRIVRPMLTERVHPIVSEPLYLAGDWARSHVPAGCVDYLVGNDNTAYWLHLAVLGNPRMSTRTGRVDTYEPRDAIIRWLTPGGLPYAIAELPALPRDVRDDLDIVADFGAGAVVKRRGPTSCDDGQGRSK